jgi:hypothetical protein
MVPAKEGAMKSDREVQRMLRERHQRKSLEQAAARAGMSVPTARKYLRAGKLPSQLRAPRSYRTRPDPFAADWPWVQAQLERDPALQAKPLFTLLCEDASALSSEKSTITCRGRDGPHLVIDHGAINSRIRA